MRKYGLGAPTFNKRGSDGLSEPEQHHESPGDRAYAAWHRVGGRRLHVARLRATPVPGNDRLTTHDMVATDATSEYAGQQEPTAISKTLTPCCLDARALTSDLPPGTEESRLAAH
jgi:hypothetical protein